MKPFVRLADDPSSPPALRCALARAAGESAPPDALDRVLGAAGASVVAGSAMGSGLVHASRGASELVRASRGASELVRASGVAPRLAAVSMVGKGVSALAIFVAGAVAGGYAMHRHERAKVPASVTAAEQRAQAAVEALQRAEGAAPSATSQLPSEPAAHAMESSEPSARAVNPSEPPAHAMESSEPSARAVNPSEPPARAVNPSEPPAAPMSAAPVSGASPPATVLTPEAVAAAPGASPSAAVPSSARAELESLRQIRDALEAHRPGDAMAAIEAHRAHYPDSTFDQELLLLEAEARFAHHDATVCSLLGTFGTRYPRSLLRRRAEVLAGRAKCLGGASGD